KDEKLSESAVNLVKLFGEKMNQRGSENQTDRNEGFKNEPVQERGEGY
ncbi:MAG: hypothetical protein H7X94_03940, partial [Vallitaleaceae bacterium]|nr:hypothetical protein [Vallitaleaceae bacterium]